MKTTTIKNGTLVAANDGFTVRIGQVCDYRVSKWGSEYDVAMDDGTFESATSFKAADRIGEIGWYIATPEMVSLYR